MRSHLLVGLIITSLPSTKRLSRWIPNVIAVRVKSVDLPNGVDSVAPAGSRSLFIVSEEIDCNSNNSFSSVDGESRSIIGHIPLDPVMAQTAFPQPWVRFGQPLKRFDTCDINIFTESGWVTVLPGRSITVVLEVVTVGQDNTRISDLKFEKAMDALH